MVDAPFFHEIAHGPEGGAAHWLTTADGLRIRAGHWPCETAKGTVLIFPGRTEFIEKYGQLARDLQGHGYASLAVDWRGQGIADRMLPDRMIGHVGQFADYQHDVAAIIGHAESLNLPRPYFLIAHSMGGCIGLRALHNGLDVAAVMFSAPMWGVEMAPLVRPGAWVMSSLAMKLGFADRLTPGQSTESYVLREDFEKNTLTNDPAQWDIFKDQMTAHPELGLGGPSLRWVHSSLSEMLALSRMPSPDVPCLTYLGTREAIVHPGRIRDRMAKWPNGTLRVIEGGLHEMLMDAPAMRDPVIAETVAHFAAHGG